MKLETKPDDSATSPTVTTPTKVFTQPSVASSLYQDTGLPSGDIKEGFGGEQAASWHCIVCACVLCNSCSLLVQVLLSTLELVHLVCVPFRQRLQWMRHRGQAQHKVCVFIFVVPSLAASHLNTVSHLSLHASPL